MTFCEENRNEQNLTRRRVGLTTLLLATYQVKIKTRTEEVNLRHFVNRGKTVNNGQSLTRKRLGGGNMIARPFFIKIIWQMQLYTDI